MRPIPLLIVIVSACGCFGASNAAPPLRDAPSALQARPKPAQPTPPAPGPPPPSGTTGVVTVIGPLQGPHGLGLTQPVLVMTRQLCGSYKLDFGDGNSMTGTLSGVNANALVHHTYEKSGLMTLVASGTGTCSGEATQTVLIPLPGTVTSVVAGPVPAMVDLNQQIRIETQGSCSKIALDFGDGANATADGPGTAETGGKYFFQFTHAYAGAGLKTVKATGANCSGVAQTTIDVKAPAGNLNNGPIPSTQINPAVIPGFTLASAGFFYLGPGNVIETANNGTVTLPVPSPNGPSNLGQDVFFRYAATSIPADVMQALANYNLSGHPNLSVTFTVAGADSRSTTNMGPKLSIQLDGSTLYMTASFDLRIALQHAPLQVNFEVTYNGKTYKAKPATLAAGNPMGSFFRVALYPTFQSERCQTCHSMGDQAALDKQHSAFYGVAPDGGFANLPGSQVQPDNTAGCDECHNQSIGVTEWKTPAFDKGINWKTMTSWQEVCYAVIGHLSTAQQRHDHFHNDPRVHWAITSGKVPPGGLSLPTAPPASFTEWLSYVDAWDSLPQPCAD